MANSQISNKVRLPTVAVLGGGWAGISAAVQLAANGFAVRLLEAEKQLGGRARCIRFGNTRVDNGQHVLLGAYQHILQMLKILKLDEASLFTRKPLHLHMMIDSNRELFFRMGAVIAPFHFLSAILRIKGITFREKLTLLKSIYRIQRHAKGKGQDSTAKTMLQEAGQTELLIEHFWRPVCLALLNTPIEIASATIFSRYLVQFIKEHHAYSEILLPLQDLGTMIPQPATEYIEANNGTVELGRTVESINIQGRDIDSIVVNGETISCDYYVIALPSENTRALLTDKIHNKKLIKNLNKLKHQAITTLYMQFPEPVQLPTDIIAVNQKHVQWLVAHDYLGQSNIIAAIVVRDPVILRKDDDQLAQACMSDVKTMFPDWPAPTSLLVVRELNAVLSCTHTVEQNRPECDIGLNNAWLAGDYVQTDLPASLESAVKSGMICTQLVIEAFSGNQT